MNMSSANADKSQVISIPESEGSNPDIPVSGQCFPSSFLTVGTAVSAKYRGAFCEATVDHVDLKFRLRVQLKTNKSFISVDETCLVSGSPIIGNEVVIRIPNDNALPNEQAGIVIRVTDSSVYTVVFDDGDKRTLRRTQLVIKGERHFKESESLDCLPLTNPEQFRQPVIDQRRKHRSGEDGSFIDENMDETEIEDVDEKNVNRDPDQNTSYQLIENLNKLADVKQDSGDGGDLNSSNVTEHNDEARARSSEGDTNLSNIVATDIKYLPTGYCRLLGRLVMIDMPLTGKDGLGSPLCGLSTPTGKSPGLIPRRRFTPAVVVLPSAMPSIDLGSFSNIAKTHKSYKLLVRSFKDNKFLAVPVAFVKRLKRPLAVELAHTYPALRPAFERALLWLDRYEFPISWGENAVQTMLGTKNWRSSKRRCRQSASDFTDSINSSPLSLKHTRASSSSSEASHSPNNHTGSIQKSRGKSSVSKPENRTRKRPRQSDKGHGSRSSSRLKMKKIKTHGSQLSDASSNESTRRKSSKQPTTNRKITKKKTNSHKSITTNSGYEGNVIPGGNLFDSVSSNEALTNSSESDSDTGSVNSSTSSNVTVSTVSTPSSISSASSTNSSVSNSSSNCSSTSSSYNSSDNSSTSSAAEFEARDRWIAQLYRFMDERGTPINKAPSLANKDLDLYKLYKLVHKLGGFHRVSSQLKWGYVYSKMDLPQNFSAGPRNLQAAFKKYLYPWDDITKKLGTNLCERPFSRPRYLSSLQNSNTNVSVTNSTVTNVTSSTSTSTRTKQSPESGNLETELKNSVNDVVEAAAAENSTVETNKSVRTDANSTNTVTTSTTTTIKKQSSDKTPAIDQQLTSCFNQSDDEYTTSHTTTPLRKSILSSGGDISSNFVSTVEDLDKPISSASSNSSSKSVSIKGRKRCYDSTMINFPLLNFGRESVDRIDNISNCIIPVRSRVRVRCGDRVAYEAKILKHLRPQPAICDLKANKSGNSTSAAAWAGTGDIQYRVHYMGWNTRHDEVVPRSRIISVVEWGRGTDEDRPPSCSSLSPIVHGPRKSALSQSKGEYGRSLSSTEISINEKDVIDSKEIPGYLTTEDGNEDDESNFSQTTETASDNITTTAPVVRRRRLLFSSIKSTRRRSSQKLSSISKRNESCSKKVSKLPLLASGCLPKLHSYISNDSNKGPEIKIINRDFNPKKLKTSRGCKNIRRTINLRGRINRKFNPIKRPRSSRSVASDISSSPNRSFKLYVKPKKMKIKNSSNESVSQISYNTVFPTALSDVKRSVPDVDCKKEPINNQQSSNKLYNKLIDQRDSINTTRTSSSSGLVSKSKLSSTLKSKIASASSAIRTKNLVSRLSKLAKRKVACESRILSRSKSKRIISTNGKDQQMINDYSKNKFSGSSSISGGKECINTKLNHVNDDSKQLVMDEHQNVECSSLTNSVIIKVDEESKSVLSNEKLLRSLTKHNLLKEKTPDDISYHLQKKLNTTDAVEREIINKFTCIEEKVSDTPTISGSLNAVAASKGDDKKINVKSSDRLQSKKSSKSVIDNQQRKTTKYNYSPPHCEGMYDAKSHTSNERKTIHKSSRSQLRHSTRNLSNPSLNTLQKQKRIAKSSTTASNIISNSSDTDSEQGINRSFDSSHGESNDSSSESVYGPNDALPRLTRSQHRQLLGDTPPGSALQTAAPAVSNLSASSLVAAKVLSNAKKSKTKVNNKVVQPKKEEPDETDITNENPPYLDTTNIMKPFLSSDMNVVHDNVPSIENEVQNEEMNVSRTEISTSLDNEIFEYTPIDKIDTSIKHEINESPMIQSVPYLSPEIVDDDNKEANNLAVNEFQAEEISSVSVIVHDIQEDVKEQASQQVMDDNKMLNDDVHDDDDDDQSSVQTMSTDPMDGLLYDLTMSSEKTRLQLSSGKEDEDVESVENAHHHQSEHHTDVPETVGSLSDDEYHPADEIVEDNEMNVTIMNKLSMEPTLGEQENEDKVVELEHETIFKSRSRVRRSSTNSNSTDAPTKRGSKRVHLTPHRAIGPENSPVSTFESPHYPPTSPHSTFGTSPLSNYSKLLQNHPSDRSVSNHRRFGGPFFPVAGFDDMSSDVKCQVLQERMHRILEAWRLAKQYLKDLDQRSNRTRRLKARQNVEILTPSSSSVNSTSTSQNCRQLIEEHSHTTNDVAYT
ncbi:AT-rich interactive domain-containing protein 4A [Schistosoma japonicum]|nr:AT-rich interactive domain-containing protein 4A [Schistosoma japonicum]